jgi:hypothetical protein
MRTGIRFGQRDGKKELINNPLLAMKINKRLFTSLPRALPISIKVRRRRYDQEE